MQDAGDVSLVRIKNADGGQHYNTEGDADAWMHVQDELSGEASIARLHIPGGILFALPDSEDTAMCLRPRNLSGPGVPYVVHGDGGVANRFPSWFSTKHGLYTRKTLRLESADAAVEINASGDVVLQDGTLKAARVTDPVRVGTLAGTTAVGGGPVTFTFIPFNADGVPQTPVVGPTITVAGVISNAGGASRVKA